MKEEGSGETNGVEEKYVQIREDINRGQEGGGRDKDKEKEEYVPQSKW